MGEKDRDYIGGTAVDIKEVFFAQHDERREWLLATGGIWNRRWESRNAATPTIVTYYIAKAADAVAFKLRFG